MSEQAFEHISLWMQNVSYHCLMVNELLRRPDIHAETLTFYRLSPLLRHFIKAQGGWSSPLLPKHARHCSSPSHRLCSQRSGQLCTVTGLHLICSLCLLRSVMDSLNHSPVRIDSSVEYLTMTSLWHHLKTPLFKSLNQILKICTWRKAASSPTSGFCF